MPSHSAVVEAVLAMASAANCWASASWAVVRSPTRVSMPPLFTSHSCTSGFVDRSARPNAISRDSRRLLIRLPLAIKVSKTLLMVYWGCVVEIAISAQLKLKPRRLQYGRRFLFVRSFPQRARQVRNRGVGKTGCNLILFLKTASTQSRKTGKNESIGCTRGASVSAAVIH